MSLRPLLGVTLGDPAGIGPEVVLRSVGTVDAGVLLLGDPAFWERRADALGVDVRIQPVESAAAARSALAAGEPGPWALDCCRVPDDLRPGHPRPECGAIALASVAAGADLAADGAIDALVTAPLNKDLVARHAPRFRGHTEWLAERAGALEPTMLFAAPRPDAGAAGPDIALLTTHLPLATALTLVRRDVVAAMLRRLGRQWSECFGRDPVIGVAALNPHGGEAGRLGAEEATFLAPAIHLARASGLSVRGPYPADSVFLRPGLDIVLALYHDQGTIMAKRAPWPTVNLTLGLPYVRTSPDHGTAYDRAGGGAVDPGATAAALRLASVLASPDPAESHRPRA